MNTSYYNRPESNTYITTQQRFTQHIRDPENQSAPDDIDDSRMKVYRNGIYLNMERMAANFFPVLKSILREEHWQSMIKDYLRDHRAHLPPYLSRLGQEFLHYLEQERDLSNEPDFILELAHYEWIEFSLSIDVRKINDKGINPEGDLLEGIPVLSPLAHPLSYRYPVHTISPNSQPDQEPVERTYIVVCRDRENKVNFIELNSISARLVEKIKQGKNKTGQVMLNEIAQEIPHVNSEVVIQGGTEIMEQLRQKDVILGIKKWGIV